MHSIPLQSLLLLRGEEAAPAAPSSLWSLGRDHGRDVDEVTVTALWQLPPAQSGWNTSAVTVLGLERCWGAVSVVNCKAVFLKLFWLQYPLFLIVESK